MPNVTGSFSLDSGDLAEVVSLDMEVGWEKAPRFGYIFELRLDAPDGKKLGEANLPAGGKGGNLKVTTSQEANAILKIKMMPVSDGKMHTLYVVSRPNNAAEESVVVLKTVQLMAN